MAKRITNVKIVIYRDKKRVVIPANTQFDFTKEELDELKEAAPDAVRTPKNEVESIVELKLPEAAGNKGGAGAKGGNNKASAAGASTDANEL